MVLVAEDVWEAKMDSPQSWMTCPEAIAGAKMLALQCWGVPGHRRCAEARANSSAGA